MASLRSWVVDESQLAVVFVAAPGTAPQPETWAPFGSPERHTMIKECVEALTKLSVNETAAWNLLSYLDSGRGAIQRALLGAWGTSPNVSSQCGVQKHLIQHVENCAATAPQAGDDFPTPGKRLTPEIRADMVEVARERIQAVRTDVPEGVDALTLAQNIVLAQEFFWLSLHFPMPQSSTVDEDALVSSSRLTGNAITSGVKVKRVSAAISRETHITAALGMSMLPQSWLSG